jgi:putative DNA primase/helicase
MLNETPEAFIADLAADEQRRKPSSRLRPITLADFLARDLPPRDNILAPWLPAKGLAMLYAQRGLGKTHMSLSLAYAVASGTSLLSWKVPAPRRVLLIDGEMPAATLQYRLAAIVERANGCEPPEADYLRVLADDLTQDGLPDLSSIEGQAMFAPHLEGTDLIIVDNISTLCRSGVENDAESWGNVQAWALEQRRAGRSVLFIHHAGKNGGQRGTSKREDVLDTVIELKRPSDYSSEDGARFEIHFTKARGFTGKDAEPLEAQLTKTGWIWRTLEEAKLNEIAQLNSEGMNQRDIAKAVGLSAATVNRRLKDIREGKL